MTVFGHERYLSILRDYVKSSSNLSQRSPKSQFRHSHVPIRIAEARRAEAGYSHTQKTGQSQRVLFIRLKPADINQFLLHRTPLVSFQPLEWIVFD